MADKLLQLYSAVLPTTAGSQLFTVPNRTLITEINVTNRSASNTNIANLLFGTINVFASRTFAAASTINVPSKTVLEPGTIVYGSTTGGGFVDLILSGVELDATATPNEVYKFMYSGSLAYAPSTAIYTVPANTKTIVKDIILCNKTATSAIYTLKFGNACVKYSSVPANETVFIKLQSILPAGQSIYLYNDGNNASAIDAYVSGVEVT